MKKIIAGALVAFAFGLPGGAQAATLDGCIAADGGSCSIIAGAEADNLAVEGTTIVGGRGSWIAAGEWTIEMFNSFDASGCSGAPYKTYSSAGDSNLVPGAAGSNNGGGYYGKCVRATAGAGSVVVLGSMHTDLLP